jgi:hypothetical protein
MPVIEVKVEGLDKIEEALERAPLRIAKKIMRDALKAAGEIWRQEIAARARRGPHHPGGGGAVQYDLLANNVGMSTTVKSDLEGSVRVGFLQKFYWAIFLEKGTGPRARRRPGMTRARSRALAREAAHQNIEPARPFVAAAGAARAQEVLDRFTEGVSKALQDEYR